MSSTVLALIVFAVLLGGAVLGAVLRHFLPDKRLDDDSRQVITLGTGLIGTIAALVLGLLIAAAKNSYDAQSTQVKQLTADIIMLDLMLEQYGPGAHQARKLVRVAIPPLVEQIWRENSTEGAQMRPFKATAAARAGARAIEALEPQNDSQRAFKSLATEAIADLARTRALLFEQGESSIPMPFLIVLVFWLTILFMSFSLHAPLSPLVVTVQLVLSLSASAAIFLILGMSEPFSGPFEISRAPLQHALAPLGP